MEVRRTANFVDLFLSDESSMLQSLFTKHSTISLNIFSFISLSFGLLWWYIWRGFITCKFSLQTHTDWIISNFNIELQVRVDNNHIHARAHGNWGHTTGCLNIWKCCSRGPLPLKLPAAFALCKDILLYGLLYCACTVALIQCRW